MKTTKILQALFLIIMTCSIISCGFSKEEQFWEGRVQPGTYTGNYTDSSYPCTNRYKLTITIFDDQRIEIRETLRSSCGSGNPETKVFYGYIHKYEETYNGERKVWYGVYNAKQDGGSWVTAFNLSTNLEYSPGDCNTYQEYSMRDKYCTLY
jgi:hypothetical protein